jgi:hypothetical protein
MEKDWTDLDREDGSTDRLPRELLLRARRSIGLQPLSCEQPFLRRQEGCSLDGVGKEDTGENTDKDGHQSLAEQDRNEERKSAGLLKLRADSRERRLHDEDPSPTLETCLATETVKSER